MRIYRDMRKEFTIRKGRRIMDYIFISIFALTLNKIISTQIILD